MKGKKPFYKKWWFWAIIIIVAIVAVAGAGETINDNNEAQPANESAAHSAAKDADPKDQIKAVINKQIDDEYSWTVIDKITINEDASSQSKGGYIALVDLTWNQKNSESTSKDVLRLYSDDLAATVANSCPDVEEVAIFWNIPYLNVNAKWAYERKGGGMALADTAWG